MGADRDAIDLVQSRECTAPARNPNCAERTVDSLAAIASTTSPSITNRWPNSGQGRALIGSGEPNGIAGGSHRFKPRWVTALSRYSLQSAAPRKDCTGRRGCSAGRVRLPLSAPSFQSAAPPSPWSTRRPRGDRSFLPGLVAPLSLNFTTEPTFQVPRSRNQEHGAKYDDERSRPE